MRVYASRLLPSGPQNALGAARFRSKGLRRGSLKSQQGADFRGVRLRRPSIFWPRLSSSEARPRATFAQRQIGRLAGPDEFPSRSIPVKGTELAAVGRIARSRKGSKGGARSRKSPMQTGNRCSVVANRSRADRYRQDAAHFRERAAAAIDPQLRASYLGLAMEYERLADVLEGKTNSRPTNDRL